MYFSMNRLFLTLKSFKNCNLKQKDEIDPTRLFDLVDLLSLMLF